MIDIFNRTLSQVFDLLLWPLNAFADVWGLVFISLLSGIIFLLIYGAVSNQKGLRRTKEMIHSCILEAVLFRHDLRTSLKAQGRMFLYAFKYVAFAVPPILILMIPCIVILAHLNLRYNSNALAKGQASIVTVKVKDANALKDLKLDVSKGLEATPPVRIKDNNEVYWRLNATEEAKDAYIKLELPGEQNPIQKRVFLGDTAPAISTKRLNNWLWAILYPGDSLLPASSVVSEISLTYPERNLSFLGIQWHWLVLFVVLSIVSGILASKVFKVEI